jgi:predicted secreted protein
VKFLLESHVGIVQMPCPEILCLGLDRGNFHGSEQETVVENTRIRECLNSPASIKTIKTLVHQLSFQIKEYHRNRFTVLGIVGINRSPSCGVNTTSMNNMEVEGEGVFIKTLREHLEKNDIPVNIIGIKRSETEKSLKSMQKLMDKK